MDYKDFKKIKDDKDFAVFSRDDGHEIKVSKKHLSKKMLLDLQRLPVHKADGGMMKAPDSSPVVEPPPSNDMGPVPPSEPNIPQEPITPPVPQQEQEAPIVGGNSRQQGLMDNIQQAIPQQSQPVVNTGAPPPAPMSEADHYRQEDKLFQQDLINGHITPKTYSDLFAEKSTLGKIGTMFGLLLSGAGSGLAQQPNAMLEMINKELDRDLDAQKTSKVNAHNFRNLTIQHEKQRADIARMDFENALTKAQTGAIPSQIAVNLAQSGNIKAETAVKSDALAHMKMNRAALAHLINQSKSMALTAEARAKLNNQIMMLSGQIDAANSNFADRAEAAGKLGDMFNQPSNNNSNPTAAQEEGFKKEQMMLRMSGRKELADDLMTKHIPGVQGKASIPITDEIRGQIRNGVTFDETLDNYLEFVKTHPGALNVLNPTDANVGKTLAVGLQNAFRASMNGGVFKKGEQDFINSVIDDDPMKFYNDLRVAPQLAVLKNDNLIKMDQLLKSQGYTNGIHHIIPNKTKGLPALPESGQKEQPKAETKFMNGVKYTKVNGGWQKS